MAQSKVLCSPVSLSLWCAYNTTTACLYYYKHKFNIFDTLVFTAWWEEAVNSIDSTINKCTGRSGHSSNLCPVSTNSTASQLVKDMEHKKTNREATRLVNKEVSDLWKVQTH